MMTVAVNAYARRIEDSRAPAMTKIGQCHKYKPYDRRPISTSSGNDSARFTSDVPERTTTAIITADATVAAARPPLYNCSSAT